MDVLTKWTQRQRNPKEKIPELPISAEQLQCPFCHPLLHPSFLHLSACHKPPTVIQLHVLHTGFLLPRLHVSKYQFSPSVPPPARPHLSGQNCLFRKIASDRQLTSVFGAYLKMIFETAWVLLSVRTCRSTETEKTKKKKPWRVSLS